MLFDNLIKDRILISRDGINAGFFYNMGTLQLKYDWAHRADLDPYNSSTFHVLGKNGTRYLENDYICFLFCISLFFSFLFFLKRVFLRGLKQKGIGNC